jgi:biotin carboxylase
MTMAVPRIMIVTASRHQAPLIVKAKSMGYNVLATDSNADAPSLSLADHSAVVDAANVSELLRVARKYQPHAIVSEQTDVAVPGVAYVADALGLPGIGYETAIRATDKWEMRKTCRSAGLPSPTFQLVKSAAEAIAAVEGIGLPVVIKPVDNQASRGVTKVTSLAAVSEAANRALVASRTGRALVEELMIGAECSVESFISGGTINVLGISEKKKCKPPFSFDLQLIYPGAFSTSQLAEIEGMNAKVIRAIGIQMGFAHAEMMVTADGVRLIEVAARGCGARVVTDLLPRLTGIDLLAARVRQASGEEAFIPPFRQELVGILRFFELPSGKVRRVSGLKEAAALPGVIHLDFGPTIGTSLSDANSADQRPGFVLAVAQNRSEAIELADRVTRLVRVEIDPPVSAVVR